MSSSTIRLVHLSDVHITARPLGWTRADWFNKRFPSWLNYQFLGRKLRFRQAEEILTALMADFQARQPDRVIFSGDATALGFEAEFARAASLFGLDNSNHLPGLAVPGNHDYCTIPAERSGLFERYFAPWQVGERVDGAIYPFAQRVGPVWLIGVNSSTGNRWAWDASGGVDPFQLKRLEQLLNRLDPLPRILITHYPICLANGHREPRSHRLRNVEDLVRVAVAWGVCLWLHGHRHDAYHLLHPPGASFPVICVGSATQNRLWSYGEYIIEGRKFFATTRVFSPTEQRFIDRQTFELRLE
ncbi:MAG TPA: metallophosphoesterase, partial [Gemmataceae bacterium]|nr:metallophosphoesterase [Gemmataceae bacterium]